MNEADTRRRLIVPKRQAASWETDPHRINEQVTFTDGCIVVAGPRRRPSLPGESTMAARLGLVNHEAIAAAKAGVIGLTLSAAATYASKGIRVNAVAPGLVRTPLTARITSNEATLNASTAMHALGRVGEPEDVASAIAWLLDPAQAWVTGQVIVGGGLAMLRSRG